MFDSALALAARIRRREISSVEAVRTSLERIEARNGELSAFTEVFARRALRSAARRDTRPSEAPFHGVPIGIKDLNLLRGSFSRFGSRSYRWLVSPVDDSVSSAIKRAGFVIVGKLATSEFGCLPVTEPDIHPPTRNPWDPSRTAGGSSGGSAAAVASGMLPIAHGSDGGGSIRIPAALCHLYGLKTSRGILPLASGKIDKLKLAVEGGLCHSVDDARAFAEALLGRPLPECRPLPQRLRVRFTTESAVSPTHPEVAAATERMAALLAEMGHEVERGEPLSGTVDDFLPLWTRLAADIPIWRESLTQPTTRWLRQRGRTHTHASVKDAFEALLIRMAEWWGDADIWLTPTVPCAPPAVGLVKDLPPEEAFRAVAPLGQFTALFNVSGQPAASIPVGISSEGWPMGVQVVGRLLEDRLVLDLSRRIEEAMPWRGRAPG